MRTEFLSHTLAAFGPAFGNHLWQSTLFAAVVWLVTLLLRRNTARVRFSLWLAASIKFLVPFSLLIGLGSLLPRQHHATGQIPTAVYSAVDTMGQPFADFTFLAADSSTHRTSLVEQAKADVPLMLAAIWLCGTAAVLVMWSLRWRQVQQQVRQATPAVAGREFEILQWMNGGRRVSLLLSQELMEPGIFRVFRPVLIWPERLSAQLRDGHIEAIMAHELMHVRRRDNLSATLHMLVEAVFWFHPMVWWMERRLVEERERACDEAVVAMGRCAETYAEGLLKACRFCIESPLACVSGVTGADLCKRVRSIMTPQLEKLGLMRKSVLVLLMLATIAGPFLFGARYGEVRAQQAIAEDWQKAAGGKMEFEVASVRLNPGPGAPSNFRLSTDDAYAPTGGLLTADAPLPTYIFFAYKIMPTREQFQTLFGQLPKWIQTENYEIHARAPTKNPTKDQMRLMMQSLLKERFGLVAHLEMQETPVLEMTLMKPGALGPQLHRHEDGPACDAKVATVHGAELKETDIFPAQCGGVEAENRPDHTILMGSRDTTMEMMAKSFQIGRLGRSVVDATGLIGKYDFILKWTPARGDFGQRSRTSSGEPESDPQGTTFEEAVKEQLGLKLKPGKAPLKVLVIDHVERPSEN
jgi:bla regulator protein BlaR1